MGGRSGPSKVELERQQAEQAKAAADKAANAAIGKGIASKEATGAASMIGKEDRLGLADVAMIRENQAKAGRSMFGRGATVLSGGIGETATGTKTLLGG
jgi:hypothetical protein